MDRRASARHRIPALAGLLTLSLAAGSGHAAPAFVPLQLSWAPGLQVFPQESPVYGVSVNVLYGDQHDVSGLDVGLFNNVKRLRGVEIGAVNVSMESVKGVQLGAGNTLEGRLTGAQVGAANVLEGELLGTQLGVANSARSGTGFQLGVLNHARHLRGLQIGILNFNESGWMKFLPLFNWNFQEPPPEPASTPDVDEPREE